MNERLAADSRRWMSENQGRRPRLTSLAGELVLDGACDAELVLELASDAENAVSCVYQSDRNHLERNHPLRKHPQWK
jgi:hypothetical protein